MGMDDLEAILPEQFKQLGQRKLVVVLVAVVAILGIMCLVLGALLGAHSTGAIGGAAGKKKSRDGTVTEFFKLVNRVLKTVPQL